MGHLGLNFNAINPKILQIIGYKVVYKLWKFRINSFQIETSTNFFIQQNSPKKYNDSPVLWKQGSFSTFANVQLPGFLSTRESFLKSNNFVKIR